MPVTYTPAPDAEQIGRQLVAKHHTHLVNERIEYVFRSEAAKSGGRVVWGKARKVSGLNAWLANPERDQLEEDEEADAFFVIELAHDVWTGLSGKQKVTLVVHELSHCTIRFNNNGDASLTVAAHDLEEFEDVVRRHGFYRSDLKHFAKVTVEVANGDQMSLLAEDD